MIKRGEILVFYFVRAKASKVVISINDKIKCCIFQIDNV